MAFSRGLKFRKIFRPKPLKENVVQGKYSKWFSLTLLAGLTLLLTSTPLLAKGIQPTSDKVAEVNGSAVSRQAFDAEINSIMQRFSSAGQNPTQAQMADINKAVLDKLIDGELLYQESQKNGFTVDNAAVNSELEKLKKQLNSSEEFKKALENWGITEEGYKEELAKNMAIQQFIEKQFIEKAVISEEETKSFYDENKSNFKQSDKVKASHILIKVEENASKSEKEAKRQKLEKIRDQIKDGADFAELAKKFSEGPSNVRGGDLGYFERGQMVKPFEAAAFSMMPGDVSDIVETQFGYHLIKVVDKQYATTLEYSQVKPQIEKHLKNQKLDKDIRNHIASLREKATIKSYLETSN